MVSPAICSAACTVESTAISACSISTIDPARTPRETWWPMPTTFGRPSSATRAMKQQTLLLPTSMAAINPFLGAMRGFFMFSVCLSPSGLVAFAGGCRQRRRRRGEDCLVFRCRLCRPGPCTFLPDFFLSLASSATAGCAWRTTSLSSCRRSTTLISLSSR